MEAKIRRDVRFIVTFLLPLLGCGGIPMDGGTPEGKGVVFDSVNVALSKQDCSTAIQLIKPLYNSGNSDNSVRMLASSAYACSAGINFFKLIGDIGSNSGSLGNSGLWTLFTKLFPSTTNDVVVESANFSIDALQAALIPGAVVASNVQINPTSNNPGSPYARDRIGEANNYMFFTSMAAIGGIQNRFGAPNPTTYKKTKNLPWNTATTMNSDGCAYASAIVNFMDAMGAFASSGGTVTKNVSTIQTAFQAAIFSACDAGCTNIPPPWGGVQSGCTVTTSCAQCPISLRDRSKCTGVANDQNSCAAAGIVNFVNTSPLGWQN